MGSRGGVGLRGDGGSTTARRSGVAEGGQPRASSQQGGSTTARPIVVAMNGGSHHMIDENDHVLHACSPAESHPVLRRRMCLEGVEAAADCAVEVARRPSGGAAMCGV